MIIDRAGNWNLYKKFGRNLSRAFDFVASMQLEKMAVGRYEIDGDKIFAMVQDYYTQPDDSLAWEAHRKYADLQIVLKGIEVMGWNHIDNMEPVTQYLEAEDYLLLKGNGIYFSIPAGYFTIFFPHDCHKVRVQDKEKSLVRKAVVKILL